ncbi:hypothetical protein QJS10_CPB13g01283 [Acorus calamus]|uniref:Uncharacterized protein n=1 Tax=Acorus calamus TaxID=4465 RepID=A0AAV9DGR2_ACOCL|nr:hypothetical protein QJS10_CPB13g01283 [Acorus calamus]
MREIGTDMDDSDARTCGRAIGHIRASKSSIFPQVFFYRVRVWDICRLNVKLSLKNCMYQ